MRRDLLWEILAHKNAKSSIEVSFLYDKHRQIGAMADEFAAWIRENFIKPHDKLEEAGFVEAVPTDSST